MMAARAQALIGVAGESVNTRSPCSEAAIHIVQVRGGNG